MAVTASSCVSIAAMRVVVLDERVAVSMELSFVACVATILELPLDEVPEPAPSPDMVRRSRSWLAGLGLGAVPVADPGSFAWDGHWLGRAGRRGSAERRYVVMVGSPSVVAYDPSGISESEDWRLDRGFVIAALDVAAGLAR